MEGTNLHLPNVNAYFALLKNTGFCVQDSPFGASYSLSRVHHGCMSPLTPNRADAERIDFTIFSTNRQTYHECFHIFWRTSRFYFADPEVLAIFLKCLNEGQKQNIRHLVICPRCNSSFTPAPKDSLWRWKSFRREVSDDCHSNKTTGKGFHLPNLATIELHLQLWGFQWETRLSHQAQIAAFRASFGAFEVLRLLRLTAAFVTLSYAEDIDKVRDATYEKLITEEEGFRIANTFRDRLLDPVVSEQHLREPLVIAINCEIERLDKAFPKVNGKLGMNSQELKWHQWEFSIHDRETLSRRKSYEVADWRRKLLDVMYGYDFTEMTMALERSKLLF